jgi:hypothetical protein
MAAMAGGSRRRWDGYSSDGMAMGNGGKTVLLAKRGLSARQTRNRFEAWD